MDYEYSGFGRVSDKNRGRVNPHSKGGLGHNPGFGHFDRLVATAEFGLAKLCRSLFGIWLWPLSHG